MPRIFDNIEEYLLPTLRSALEVGVRADFCVGYFNLRGWSKVDDLVENFAGGESACCRLLVGIPQLPQDILYESRSLLCSTNTGIDNSKVLQFKKQVATEFRQQLIIGTPSNEDEAGLRRLSAQIRAGKLVIRLYLKSLHAKLYLVHRHDVQALLGLPLKIYQGIHFSGVDNPLTLTGREVHFLLACLITRTG